MNLSASLAPSADGTFRKDFSTSVRAHELGPTPTSNSADKVSRAGAGTLRNPAIARFPIPAGMIGERTSRRGSNLLNPLTPPSSSLHGRRFPLTPRLSCGIVPFGVCVLFALCAPASPPHVRRPLGRTGCTEHAARDVKGRRHERFRWEKISMHKRAVTCNMCHQQFFPASIKFHVKV